MSSGYFSVGIYGQSGLVMDWFGLNDPFTQQLPIKITNAWSGTIWVQGELINPPTGVYASYSGVSLSGVNSGASTTIVMTWNVNVSGQTATSSPVTHALTLGLLAFTSSNYTGALASGNFAFNNTLFSRWSGMIKVFGDIYSNDQPTPSLIAAGTGTLGLSGYYYAVSYILSGWESDIGVPTFIVPISGALSISWGSVAGVSQYLLWRWSGVVGSTFDNTLYSGTSSVGTLLPIDLIAIQAGTSFTDNGVAVIQSGMFRHRNWQRASSINRLFTSDTSVYLSPPASRQAPVSALFAHGYQLNKNLSGTNLLGPFYGVLHQRYRTTGSQPAIALQTGVDGYISGTTIADAATLSGTAQLVWYRHGILLGASGSLSASGDIHLQLQINDGAGNVDDVFIVAQS